MYDSVWQNCSIGFWEFPNKQFASKVYTYALLANLQKTDFFTLYMFFIMTAPMMSKCWFLSWLWLQILQNEVTFDFTFLFGDAKNLNMRWLLIANTLKMRWEWYQNNHKWGEFCIHTTYITGFRGFYPWHGAWEGRDGSNAYLAVMRKEFLQKWRRSQTGTYARNIYYLFNSFPQ